MSDKVSRQTELTTTKTITTQSGVSSDGDSLPSDAEDEFFPTGVDYYGP